MLDVSRTFLCGDEGTAGQKEAYRIAYDCVNGMRELMKPGMRSSEFSHAAPKLAGGICEWPLRHHGPSGRLEDEGPGIPYPQDLQEESPGDRVIRENMVFCLECYAGKDGEMSTA